MSLNDKDPFLGGNKGVNVIPGVANSTPAGNPGDALEANFVNDPTTTTRGAGAGPNFEGDAQAKRHFAHTAGVVEGRPSIIESANIDPLNENSNKDDGWANATRSTSSGSHGGGLVSNAASVASGAATLAYGTVTGNEKAQQSGREAIYVTK